MSTDIFFIEVEWIFHTNWLIELDVSAFRNRNTDRWNCKQIKNVTGPVDVHLTMTPETNSILDHCAQINFNSNTLEWCSARAEREFTIQMLMFFWLSFLSRFLVCLTRTDPIFEIFSGTIIHTLILIPKIWILESNKIARTISDT